MPRKTEPVFRRVVSRLMAVLAAGPAVAAVAIVAAVAGCSSAPPVTPVQPAPEGLLTITETGAEAAVETPPADWIVVNGGKRREQTLRHMVIDGVSALEIRSAAEPTMAVRRIDAWLLPTPFLTWWWHLSDHGQGVHPVRIIVGFLGGAPEDADVDVLGGDLPPHDRALALVWGDTMLKRGHLTLPDAQHPERAPIYTARGGRENTRRWWRETVDLSAFYARAWPGDDMRRARIAFVGIAAAPHTPAVRGRVAHILLTQ